MPNLINVKQLSIYSLIRQAFIGLSLGEMCDLSTTFSL